MSKIRPQEPKSSLTFAWLLFAAIGGGTLGYSFIEGWHWFDALYMTVITISTIGYQEVYPLSDYGRAFTILMVFSGVSVFGYGIKELIESQSLLDRDELRRRRMSKIIKELRGHTIICGFGRMGQTVAEDLDRSGQDFVVIESDPIKQEHLNAMGYLYIQGDASDDNELIEANIEVAKAMVICINSDADTLYTLVAAKNINPDVFTICRTNDELARVRLTRIGADKIVQPITVTGREVARDIVLAMNEVPYSTADLSFCSDSHTYILEYKISKESDLLGLNKEDLVAKMKDQSFVTIGVLSSTDEFTFIAKLERQVEVGDRIIGASDISEEAV